MAGVHSSPSAPLSVSESPTTCFDSIHFLFLPPSLRLCEQVIVPANLTTYMIKVSFNDGSWWVFKDQNLANAVIEAKRDKLVEVVEE